MKNLLLTLLLLTGAISLTAEQYYWIGGTGNWSDPTHWSLSNDGTGGSAGMLPTSIDNVYFNEYSFSGGTDTIYINDQNIFCKEMDWAELSTRVVLHFDNGGSGQNVNISGSLILNSFLSIEGDDANWIFNSDQQGNIILTEGVSLPNVKLDNELGTWSLLDPLFVEETLRLASGTLVTFDNDIYCEEFDASGSNSRKLSLGNMYIDAENSIEMEADNFTLSAGNSTLICPALLVNDLQLNDVILTSAQPKIAGSNITVNNLNTDPVPLSEFQGAGNNFTFVSPRFIFPAGETLTILGDFTPSSLCNNPMEIVSSIPGTQAMLVKAGGTINLRDVHLKDIAASGGADFSAIDSFDDGNNSGWTIIPPTVICNLPVALTHFDASCENHKVTLKWTTETEIDCDYFSIQKSDYGEEFEEIAQISGAGTTAEIQQYRFVETNVKNGRSYYRLQQIDFDGTYMYSDVVVTSCGDALEDVVQVYPNPVSKFLKLELNLEEDTNIGLRICDFQGRQVKQNTYSELSAGYHTLPIDMSALKAGMYIIEIYINEQFLQKKLIKF